MYIVGLTAENKYVFSRVRSSLLNGILDFKLLTFCKVFVFLHTVACETE